MQIPFLGGSYQGRSTDIDASRSVNFYLEMSAEPNAKSAVALIGTPGTRTFTEYPASPIRLSYSAIGRCFVVAGNRLFEQFSDGSRSRFSLGVLNTSTGRISAADNGVIGHQILLVDGVNGYIFDTDTNTFSVITDPGFPANPKQVAQLDGYFVVTNGTTGFQVSDLYNGLVYPGLAFANVVGTSDSIQKPVALYQQMYFVKQNSTEVWYDAAVPTSQGSPFQRVQGAVIDWGTPAEWSVARGNNAIFFLANTRSIDGGEFAGVVMLQGYQGEIISPPCINYRIEQFERIDDAFAFIYNDEGHTFYWLTFPTADATFVYDLTTRMWHERSTHIGTGQYEIHRHLAETYTYFEGKHLVGHYNEGKTLEMSSGIYDDDGEPIISWRTSQPLFDRNALDNIKIPKLILDCEGGVGDGHMEPADPFFAWIADGTHYADGSGYAGGFNMVLTGSGDPQGWLSWSNDGGHTWSSEYAASIGVQGEYKRRLTWRRLGAPRKRIFRFAMVDKVKKVIIGAYVP